MRSVEAVFFIDGGGQTPARCRFHAARAAPRTGEGFGMPKFGSKPGMRIRRHHMQEFSIGMYGLPAPAGRRPGKQARSAPPPAPTWPVRRRAGRRRHGSGVCAADRGRARGRARGRPQGVEERGAVRQKTAARDGSIAVQGAVRGPGGRPQAGRRARETSPRAGACSSMPRMQREAVAMT